MNEAPAIVRASLHDQVVERVREMILTGEFIGGQRVPEKALCQQLGISRTPLREALKVLAREGLIELLPNRGARIARLTAADVDEMFPVMGALEGLAGALACERITDAEIDAIRAVHYRMASQHKLGELAEYFALNQQIHEMIFAAAGNPTLESHYRALAQRIRLARYRANMSRARWNQAMAEHEEILEALGARNGPRLSEVLQRHLRNTCESVKAVIAAGGTAPSDAVEP